MDLCCQVIGWQAQEICISGRGREWAAGIGDKEGAEDEGSLGAGDDEWAEGLPRHLRGPGSIIFVHMCVHATS